MYLLSNPYLKRDANVNSHPSDLHIGLMEQIVENKDKVAFEKLFVYFAPRVKALMMKHGANSDIAEDLMQETMLTVWNKSGQFSNTRGSVSAWIFTIARNKRIDGFRKQGTRHYVDIEDYEIVDDSETIDDVVISKERDNIVATAAQNLPTDQREIVSLSFVEDMTQIEISRKLGLPLGTVKSRLRLAYLKMRNELAGEL